MFNSEHIQSLEDELAQAKRDSEPRVVEEISRDKDAVVYQDQNGVTRRDCLGGVAPVYAERPILREPERLVDRPWDKEQGKIIKENSDERVIKLSSGAIRTDIKTVEEPVKPF